MVPTGWVCLPGIDPLVIVDNPAIVVESVKLAEDRSGDVVVRLYESRGAPAKASVTPPEVSISPEGENGLAASCYN